MDDDCCELLQCCCQCGLCLGLCCLCCKDKDNSQRNPYVTANGPQVTVTNQPIPQPYQAQGGYIPGPYPSASMGPQPPQPAYPPPPHTGHGYPPGGVSVYPPGNPAGYPPGNASGYHPPQGNPGYPPQGGFPQPGGYPPGPPAQPGFQHQPPPYDIAMSMPNPQQPQTEMYGKQAPYNPHYQS